MKIITKDEKTYLLRFDRGEEAMEGVRGFCVSEGIGAGYFSMIGAAESVIISFYDLGEKKYNDTILEGPLEITGVTGNIAKKDGGVVLHAHGTFSDNRFSTKGGHVKEILISATGEVVLTPIRGVIERSYDDVTGLNLMQ